MMMPDSAAIDPMERSMPRWVMTKVIAIGHRKVERGLQQNDVEVRQAEVPRRLHHRHEGEDHHNHRQRPD